MTAPPVSDQLASTPLTSGQTAAPTTVSPPHASAPRPGGTLSTHAR